MARCAATNFNAQFTKGLKTVELNFLTAHKKYWRTQQKLNSCCVACGAPPPLEMHHIRKLNGKNAKPFSQLMGQLGRKQVALCKQCHYMVHRGLYNGIGLRDLFSSKLATAEGQIVYNDPNIPDILRWDDPTQRPNIKTQQVRFAGAEAYVISQSLKRIVSKYICANEHEFIKYKKHEYIFDNKYYSNLLKNKFNDIMDL